MPESKDYAKRLVKGSTIVFAAFIASEVIGVFLRMILARSLTVPEYGLFYAVFSLVSLFALFRDPGISSSLTKHIAEFTVHKRFAKIKSSIVFSLIVQVIAGLVISAMLFIFSDYIALAIFKTPIASLPLRILSVWFLVEAFRSLLSSMSQGFQNMPILALFNFTDVLLIFLFATCFVGILGLGLNGVALAYPLATISVSIFGIAFFVKRYRHVFQKKVSITKPLVKKLLVFALPVFLGGFGGLILTYTDTLTLTIFRTLTEVGYYQAAQPSARILWYIPTTLTVVLYPMISELWAKKDKKLLGRALHFLIKFSFILIMPAALVFIAFPEIVINLLFGSSYLAGVVVLQIFGVAALLYVVYDILVTVIAGIGRPGTTAKIVGAMAVFNLIGDIVLVPIYGIEGAATTTFVAFLLGVILLIYYARKFIGFTVPAAPLLKSMMGGILTLILILGLKSILPLSPWPKTFAVMIPSLLFYGTWILATRAITKDDLRFIKEIVPIPGWLAKVARKIFKE